MSSVYNGVSVSLLNRKLEGIEALGGKVLCTLIPNFPEWYVYVLGEDFAKQSERIDILVDLEGAFNEMVSPENRLPEGKIAQMYLAFLQEIYPQFSDNEVGQAFVAIHTMLSKICGLDVESEGYVNTFIELPDQYKEYILFSMNSRIKPKIIPHLLEMVSD